MKQTYNDFYEKKYNRKRRMQTLAIVLMMLITIIVFALGFKREAERQDQLVKEGEQYYSSQVDTKVE